MFQVQYGVTKGNDEGQSQQKKLGQILIRQLAEKDPLIQNTEPRIRGSFSQFK